VDVRRLEDLGGFAQADPVRCRSRHQPGSPFVGAVDFEGGSFVAVELGVASLPEVSEVAAAGVSAGFASVEPDPGFEVALRSFFAQPEPLKWTVGAEIAFLTGPLPHSGQDAGGSAWTPWMTSKRRPHAAQS
jgi:hypothetical protein